MIDFSHFYQQIAKGRLTHWLETLPAQLACWQREAQHGQFATWSRAVDFLPALTPCQLDLRHSVTAESQTPLSEGQRLRIENLLKNLMPWRKGLIRFMAWISIPSGVQTGNGSVYYRTFPISGGGSFWMSVVAVVITYGG